MVDTTRLDLGCGIFKKEGYVGIDSYDWSNRYPKEDFLCGVLPEVLTKFPENSISLVNATHFIEHVPPREAIQLFNQVYRILEPNGLFEIWVPPSTGRGAFCDPTHVSFWNDMSFRYYDMSWCRELSESYGIKCDFEVLVNQAVDEFNLHALLRKR